MGRLLIPLFFLIIKRLYIVICKLQVMAIVKKKKSQGFILQTLKRSLTCPSHILKLKCEFCTIIILFIVLINEFFIVLLITKINSYLILTRLSMPDGSQDVHLLDRTAERNLYNLSLGELQSM